MKKRRWQELTKRKVARALLHPRLTVAETEAEELAEDTEKQVEEEGEEEASINDTSSK